MEIFNSNHFKLNERPFVLGLTTTLINANVENIKEHLINLQETFNGIIKTCYKEDITV